MNDLKKRLPTNIYDMSATAFPFLDMMRENCIYHYNSCAEYKVILDAEQFVPNMLRTKEALSAVPPLTKSFLQNHSFLPASNKTISFRDLPTQLLIRSAAKQGLSSILPIRYVLLGCTDHGQTRLAPVKQIIQVKDNVSQGVDALRSCSYPSKFPLWIFAEPAFLFRILKRLQFQQDYINLSDTTLILCGDPSQIILSPQDTQVLNFLVKLVLDLDTILYALYHEEHPLWYWRCPEGHYHIPSCCRVIVRDVFSFAPLPYESPGLINFITPLFKTAPLLSVLTESIGTLHRDGTCSCGIEAPYLTFADPGAASARMEWNI